MSLFAGSQMHTRVQRVFISKLAYKGQAHNAVRFLHFVLAYILQTRLVVGVQRVCVTESTGGGWGGELLQGARRLHFQEWGNFM